MAANPIKILHLITGLNLGGAEVSMQRLLCGMDRNQFENVVVSLTGPGPLSSALGDQGIRVSEIHMSRSLPSPASIWRLYRLMRKEQPDIVQTWLYHSDLFGLLVGRAARVPVVAWNLRCSNMGQQYQQGVNRMLLRVLTFLSRFPNAIVANSHAGQEEHTAMGYKAKRWIVLPNGFDFEEFKPNKEARIRLFQELGLPDDKVLIGLVARYDPLKNHEGFLHAAAQLLSETQDAHFVLAGNSIDKDNVVLNRLINQLGLRDKVHLLGQRKDMPKITAGLDIATCCSLSEGFPNVVGEAMSCAVPCVVSDVGDAARIVGDTGIIVPVADVQALAEGWCNLISKGAAERSAMGERALKRVRSQYSLARCVEQYQSFYEDLSHCVMRSDATRLEKQASS